MKLRSNRTYTDTVTEVKATTRTRAGHRHPTTSPSSTAQINSKSSRSTPMKSKTLRVLKDLKNKNSASTSESFRPMTAKCSGVGNSGSGEKKKIADKTDDIKNSTKTDLKPKEFRDLPVEIKEMILQKLRLTDLRADRRVCKEWRDICSKLLNYRTYDLGDQSSLDMEGNLCKCSEIFVSYLTKTPLHDSTTFNGSTIRVLSLKNPNLESETVQWILRSCVNLEEIRIDYFGFLQLYFHDHEKRFNDFLNSKLLKYISLCQNLIKLDISIGRRQSSGLCWRFNFEALNACPKLEYINFRSRVPFQFYNRVNVIPPTVKKCNILMLLDEGENPRTLALMVNRLRPKIQTDDNDRYYSISDSSKGNELKNYLPSLDLDDCIIKPNNKEEFKFLMRTLPGATRHLQCNQSSDITSIISISINQ